MMESFKLDQLFNFLKDLLLKLAVLYADELDENRKIAEEIGGTLTLSEKVRVNNGPLAGHWIRLSIEIDPDDIKGNDQTT